MEQQDFNPQTSGYVNAAPMTPPPSSTAKKKNVGAIIGGIIGFVIAFIVAFVGVSTLLSNSGDVKKFAGTWNTKLDMTDAMFAEFEEAPYAKYFDKNAKFTVDTQFVFSKDGTYKITVSEDSYTEMKKTLADEITKALLAYAKTDESFKGFSDEEILSALASSGEGTFQEQLMAEMGSFEDFSETIAGEGNFTAKNTHLCLSDSLEHRVDPDVYFSYSLIDEDTISLNQYHSDDADESDITLPFVLKRVK